MVGLRWLIQHELGGTLDTFSLITAVATITAGAVCRALSCTILGTASIAASTVCPLILHSGVQLEVVRCSRTLRSPFSTLEDGLGLHSDRLFFDSSWFLWFLWRIGFLVRELILIIYVIDNWREHRCL